MMSATTGVRSARRTSTPSRSAASGSTATTQRPLQSYASCVLTGRIPLRYGVDRPIETVGGLPETERLLTDVLKAAGYETAVVGKWHLGLAHVKHHPYNRGFDTAYGHLGPAVDYWTHIWDGGLDWHRNGSVLNEEGYTTELIGKEAERVISERDKTKPLFLYVAFNAPHGPLQAPAESESAYDSHSKSASADLCSDGERDGSSCRADPEDAGGERG